MKGKLIISGIAALAIVCSAWLISGGIRHFRGGDPSVSVVGLSERDITSDLMVWNITVKAQHLEQAQAYNQLKSSKEKVLAYLTAQGITPEEMELSSIDVTELNEYSYDASYVSRKTKFLGYSLSLSITIRTSRVEETERVYSQISELLSQGVDMLVHSPQYYYTKLSELKMDMLQEAAQDARARASIIAEGSGAKVSALSSSSQGVFQVVGKNQQEEYSWGGTFNTSSKQKVASVTVRATFKL